jgi:S-formylglutathione hydrolase FrmB
LRSKQKIFKEETTMCFKRTKERTKEFQLLFAALILSIALLATPSIEPAFAGGKLITDTITSPSLKGNLLGDPATRNMVVYLPPGYDTSGERYPVVYLIPGPGFTERYWPYNDSGILPVWITPPTDFPKDGFVSMIDELITTGKVQPIIIVMLNLDAKYGGSWGANSALNGNHEDYVINDIVPYIDATYRTLSSRDSRAIGGLCMGGYVAMYLGMRHPDVFGAVASLNGALAIMFLLSPGALKLIAAENPNGITGPPIRFPYPDKFWASDLYMESAAWSPNPNNPPYYMDLPVDKNIQLREDIVQKWSAYDLFQMLPNYVSALASLRGIYLDAGDKDEVSSAQAAQMFSDALSAAGIDHRLEIFDGKHMDKMYTRLKLSLSYLSNVLVGVIPPKDYSNVFFMPLTPGLNMVSLPLEPITPYTARSFAKELSATVVIKLDEARQRFVGFTLDAPDDGFQIEGGKGYIVNVPEGRVVAFTGAAWTNQPPVEASPSLAQSDGAWAFVVSGRILECEKALFASLSSLRSKLPFAVTVRNTRTNAVATDVVHEGYFAVAFADLNRKNVVQTGDRLEIQVQDQSGEIASETLSYTVTVESILQAFLPINIKNVGVPRQSLLLQNYPNPFNPETWIPYQLREPAEVVIFLYNANGQLVRTLSLGQRSAGFYLGRTKAAYWDGHNDAGEKVASGIYFYQIKAGDFSAMRKMLIVK